MICENVQLQFRTIQIERQTNAAQNVLLLLRGYRAITSTQYNLDILRQKILFIAENIKVSAKQDSESM